MKNEFTWPQIVRFKKRKHCTKNEEIRNGKHHFLCSENEAYEKFDIMGDINIKDVNIDANKLTLSIFQPSKE